MGTQRSSDGPGSGVPLIPSWVQPVNVPPGEAPEDTEKKDDDKKNGNDQKEATPPTVSVDAPPGRFRGARTSLGRFASSGSRRDLQAGLGHYVRSGLGGSGYGARRLGGTASAAGRLYGGLQGYSAGEAQPPELGLNKADLSGKPAREVGDRIIDAICPVDGSQDTEARRDSLSRSISELAEEFPNLDLTALTEEQISLLTERFVAYDVCHRIELDVGKAMFLKAADPATAVKRIEELRQYVREKVSAVFREKSKQGTGLTRREAAVITAGVIRDTLAVFEEYVE